MEKTIKAYTAGIVDGEGYVGITRSVQRAPYRTPRYMLKVQIGMTDKIVIDWLVEKFGFNLYIKRPDFKHRRRAVFTADLQSIKAESFLKLIKPWLICKKEQALLGIEFQRNCTLYAKKIGFRRRLNDVEVDKRHQYYLKIRDLNGRKKGVQNTFCSPHVKLGC